MERCVQKLTCEIRRMLTGRSFRITVVLGILGMILGTSFPELNKNMAAGNFLVMEQGALSSQIVCFLLPVLSVLPWSDSFLEEWRDGFLKSALPRTGRMPYVENKILSVALGGFLAVIFSGLTVLLGYFIFFFPREARGAFPAEEAIKLGVLLLRAGLLCAILGSLGGLCGALTGSSYMAYGLPFVGYYFCIILHERYFPELFWIDPKEWLSPSAWWEENNLGLWLFLVLFLGIMMGLHGGVLYGRVEEV